MIIFITVFDTVHVFVKKLFSLNVYNVLLTTGTGLSSRFVFNCKYYDFSTIYVGMLHHFLRILYIQHKVKKNNLGENATKFKQP